MSIMSQIKTTLWFVSKPKYWVQYFELAKRKIFGRYDRQKQSELAKLWAENNAVNYTDAWKAIGITGDFTGLDKSLLEEARKLAMKFDGLMGGPGHIDFIYDAVRILKAKDVVVHKKGACGHVHTQKKIKKKGVCGHIHT